MVPGARDAADAGDESVPLGSILNPKNHRPPHTDIIYIHKMVMDLLDLRARPFGRSPSSDMA